MTKVHPHATAVEEPPRPESPRAGGGRAAAEATVLTVWRKSLLFNGNGFTVFDSKGHLVFRVDNYSSVSRDCIVLMDATGKPLLTIRRKKLSLGEHWRIYDGEEAINPRFAVKKKHTGLLHSKGLARVTPCASGTESRLAYDAEGSYSRRCCAIYDSRRRQLAEIQKRSLLKAYPLASMSSAWWWSQSSMQHSRWPW